MSGHNHPAEGYVRCDVCLKEIPVSEAKNVEATDYVAHFCGLDCYQKWKAQGERGEHAGRS
jgi:hypothetical protein